MPVDKRGSDDRDGSTSRRRYRKFTVGRQMPKLVLFSSVGSEATQTPVEHTDSKNFKNTIRKVRKI
eukprot:1365454-Amorphochlora_amoeboformis.AAC.1